MGKTAGTLLSWCVGILLFLCGLVAALKDGAIVSGIAFILAGLLLLPILQERLKAIFMPFSKTSVKATSIIACVLLAGLFLPSNKTETPQPTTHNRKEVNKADKVDPPMMQNLPQKFELKEVVAYETRPYSKPGYEDIRGHNFGVYLKIYTDTTGVAEAIVNYLLSKDIGDRDAAHVWVFTDSSVIPKSFEGDWSNKRSEQKCFAHALRPMNGKISYDYDIFMEYKP